MNSTEEEGKTKRKKSLFTVQEWREKKDEWDCKDQKEKILYPRVKVRKRFFPKESSFNKLFSIFPLFFGIKERYLGPG